MTNESVRVGISHAVHISTNTATGCKHCRFSIDGKRFEESVNHYVEEHGYKVLHIVTETDRDFLGQSRRYSLAVVGK